jgi:hypothetical protein
VIRRLTCSQRPMGSRKIRITCCDCCDSGHCLYFSNVLGEFETPTTIDRSHTGLPTHLQYCKQREPWRRSVARNRDCVKTSSLCNAPIQPRRRICPLNILALPTGCDLLCLQDKSLVLPPVFGVCTVALGLIPATIFRSVHCPSRCNTP